MCNELLKNAFLFHFYGIRRSFYTLRRDFAHSNFHFAYNSITKGTKYATSCLKMHFVSIFAASVEVFIRCLVILPRAFSICVQK